MLNLLRYRDGGQASYAIYAQHLRETYLPRYGGEVLYLGTGSTALVAEDGQVLEPSSKPAHRRRRT